MRERGRWSTGALRCSGVLWQERWKAMPTRARKRCCARCSGRNTLETMRTPQSLPSAAVISAMAPACFLAGCSCSAHACSAIRPLSAFSALFNASALTSVRSAPVHMLAPRMPPPAGPGLTSRRSFSLLPALLSAPGSRPLPPCLRSPHALAVPRQPSNHPLAPRLPDPPASGPLLLHPFPHLMHLACRLRACSSMRRTKTIWATLVRRHPAQEL